MKILHVAPYSPVPPNFGGALRIYHILKALSMNHDVTFVAIGTEENRRELVKNFGENVKSIHVVPPYRNGGRHSSRLSLLTGALASGKSLFFQGVLATEMQSTLDEVCKTEKPDVAILEFPATAQFRLPPGIIKVLDEHNVEYSNLERMYKGTHLPVRKAIFFREHKKLYGEEIEVCRQTDAIFTTSENDLRILDAEVPLKDKYVIPNGVETEYFFPSGAPIEPFSMVYTGTMDYYPNQDAMHYFLDKIFPIIKESVPQAKLYIVGKNPSAALKRRASDDVIVTGFVDDVRPFTNKAAVYVVPLRMGSGTRLKILEGLSMKKAIVTTTIGCEGIDVTDGVNVEISDSPETFAAKVIALFNDPARSKELGEKGFDLVKNEYDWGVVAKKIESALESLLERQSMNIRLPGTPAPVQQPTTDLAGRETTVKERHIPVKVLMYHRVVDDSVRTTGYTWTVSVSQLRQQLSLLDKWGYTCISFRDYTLYREGKLVLPRKPVILTFDDGYDEIFDNAIPLLKEFGVKATMFVLGDRSIRSNLWDADPDIKGVPLLAETKVRQLYHEGFEIGSHSLTHSYLSKMSGGEAWKEIAGSKQRLEDLIGAPVASFAYPFGSQTNAIKEMVQTAGYTFGVGVFSGPPKFGDDTYNIRRIPITRSTNLLNFAFKILTPYEYYAWLRWKVHQSAPFPFTR